MGNKKPTNALGRKAKVHKDRPVTDDQRRQFLKLVGVASAGAASINMSDIAAASDGIDDIFVEAGETIRKEMSDDLDAELIAEKQAELASAAADLPEAPNLGYPDKRRDTYSSVAAPAWEIHDHLVESGFYQSTADHLPNYDVEFVESTLDGVLGSDHFVDALTDLGFSDDEVVDLLATVVDRAEELSSFHWTSHEVEREAYIGPTIDSMTKLSAAGALLWIDDLDDHIFEQQILISEEMLAAAAWHAHSMATGFYILSEAARLIAARGPPDGRGPPGNRDDVSDGELGAAISLGFAVESISQYLTAEDVYWITQEMRRDPDEQPLVPTA